MCSECGINAPVEAVVEPVKAARRLKLWEVRGSLHCSILGTCLSHDDLLHIARKCRLQVPAEITPYDLHGYCVHEAGKAVPLTRAMHKLLEQRYAGIIRKVGACTTFEEMTTLWETEYAAGRIAGAYWAFLSHSHTPAGLEARIFGEVHMLSHLLGRATHQTASRASEMQSRIEDLEARLERLSERHNAVLAERDRALSQAAAQRSAAPCSAVRSNARRDNTSLHVRRSGRTERALIAARERARSAEQRVNALQEEVQRLKMLLDEQTIRAPQSCPAAEACDEAVRESIARSVLYIGGRTGAIDQIRRVATRAHAELIHHDGGEEHALARIDGLVQGCDAVFCPIDCVSHSACLKAKALCRKFRKPFVPLRSSGASSFEKALASFTAVH